MTTSSTIDTDFVEGVRDFLDKRLPSQRHRELLAGGAWDDEFTAELRALGWFDVTVPEVDGGLEVPLSEVGGLARLVGERLVPGPLIEQLVLPALIPGLSGGGERSVLALADPGVSVGSGGGLGGVSFDGATLNGTVELVRFGAQADVIVVAVDGTGASGGGTDAAALVVVSANDCAVEVVDLVSLDPVARYARVTVHGLVAPESALARGAPALALLRRIRAWMRLFTACELAGIAGRVLDDTVVYVKERRQFDRPIGSFQAVQHIAASMAQGALSLDALCDASVADAAVQDGPDLELTAMTAKAYAAQASRLVCEDGLQAHGGIGFTTALDLQLYLRRALALRAWYGDDHELASLIGVRRLGDTGFALTAKEDAEVVNHLD